MHHDEHQVIARSPHERDAFPALKRLLYAIQSKKLWYKRRIRARRERVVLISLIDLLYSRPDVLVRRTDKSKVLYVGSAETFTRETMQYI